MSEGVEQVAILSGDDVPRGDSSQPQQQEITVEHPPHMSIDELLEVIKGANGMPVMFVPSSDGRLAAVAVDGHQNLLTPNRKDNGSTEKNEQNLRGWLLLLTSLAATVTFTAGLTPPGGFWPADDKANGYEAGTSIMRDKFPMVYLFFYCSNTTAFFTSLLIIAMLASNNSNRSIMLLKRRIFTYLTVICFYTLGMSYVRGTSASKGPRAYTGAMFICLFAYTMLPIVKPDLPVIVRKNILLESTP